jgi:hypothetical protein
MTTNSPIKWKDLDFAKIKLGKEKRKIKLYYQQSTEPITLTALHIQLPHMYMPFNIRENENKSSWTNFKEYQLDCSLQNQDLSEVFDNFMTKLNETIINLINESGDFENNCTTNNFNPIMRQNLNYKPLLKLNIKRDADGDFKSFVFNKLTIDGKIKNQTVVLKDSKITDILKKRTVFIPSIECGKVYFYKDNYGTIWDLVQMLIFPQKEKTANNSANSENSTSMYTNYAFN